MGKLLLRKTSKGLTTILSVLTKFGEGAGYALRH